MKKPILIFFAAAGIASVATFVVVQRPGQTNTSASGLPAQPVSLSPAEVEALKNKAESGDAAAQTRLGWLYQKGDGTKPDMKESVKWFQKAADQNYPDALAALGEMTQAGQGVKADLAEAARLYRMAAERGNVAGQYNLAYLYEQGTGVEKSQTEAAKWYELAAQGGDPLAQYDIGQRYMLGLGVQTNFVQAFKWLTLAGNQGQTDSSRLLGRIKLQMTSAQIAEASQLVATMPTDHASVSQSNQ